MADKLKIAIAGSAGRMGKTLIEAVLGSNATLAFALEQPGSPVIGKDAGEFLGKQTGVKVSADITAAFKAADVLIDFTQPAGTMQHLEACIAAGKKLVIGTTGLSEAQKQVVRDAAKKIAIVMAPSMSVGVNVLFKLAEVAAKTLDEGFDIEIIEAHHRLKVDAPSGTALRLGEVVAGATGRDLARDAVHGREGETGVRSDREIGFHAVRGGDIVGEHTVMFAGAGERVELTVRSGSRVTYATGALRACSFLAGKSAGLYDMQDVLGLR